MTRVPLCKRPLVQFGSCLLPSGSASVKWENRLSYLTGFFFLFFLLLWWMKGFGQEKALCAARHVECGVLGSRLGVGGGCEIVACRTGQDPF